jgi:predicted small metal-binding protein
LIDFVWVALGERRNDMEKLLRCSDLGTDCGFEACGDTTDEVLKTLFDHARAIHGLKDIPEKDAARLRKTVQQAFCAPKGGYNPGRG